MHLSFTCRNPSLKVAKAVVAKLPSLFQPWSGIFQLVCQLMRGKLFLIKPTPSVKCSWQKSHNFSSPSRQLELKLKHL